MALAERFLRVEATDASAEQIAHATTHPRVRYRVALAERSPLDSGSVDVVTVANAVHWFDLARFYEEVRRVTRPSAAIVVWCYPIVHVTPEVDRVITHFYDVVLGPYWPAERRLVEDGYRDLPFPFRELASPSFRLEIEWALDDMLGYLGTWSACQRAYQATGDDPLHALRPRLEEAWGDPATRHLCAWPLAVRAGRLP